MTHNLTQISKLAGFNFAVLLFTKLEYDVSLIKEEKDKNANILQNPVNTQVSISDDTPEINSDIYEDSVIPTSPIPAEAISLEEKEENEFLNLRYKEQVGKEIMERIREKKCRDQDLSLDNTLSEPSYDDQNLKSSTMSQPISATASGNISDLSFNPLGNEG